MHRKTIFDDYDLLGVTRNLSTLTWYVDDVKCDEEIEKIDISVTKFKFEPNSNYPNYFLP